MCWASWKGVSPSAMRHGQAWTGGARSGVVGPGLVWSGPVRQGLQTAARSPSGFPAALSGAVEVGPGSAWQGRAQCGAASHGAAWCGMGHRRWHGGIRSLPAILSGMVLARRGKAWSGAVRFGWVRQGLVRLGSARCGQARQALVRHGLFDDSTEGFGLPCCPHFRAVLVRRGLLWSG